MSQLPPGGEEQELEPGSLLAAKTAEEAGRGIGSLLVRLLGPATDEVAIYLAYKAKRRIGNAMRILERAEAKGGQEGYMNERVADRILDDGLLLDDSVAVDYVSGLLAGSRSPNGRDDRAVTWAAEVTSMSTLQIRAHYLLYREWASRLHGRADVQLNVTSGTRKALMLVEYSEFVSMLVGDHDIDRQGAITHAIIGIHQAGLIGQDFALGDKKTVAVEENPFRAALKVTPTIRGIELYGWASGDPSVIAPTFTRLAAPFDTDPPLPRLTRVVLPKLEPAS
ncbi:hypothetical protein [Jiangella endophytica]|uniref:hypothetical protein n=1 Tax=Jiangella endophytica TaxID=1623398 RepID=UPI00130061D4|nr:hypothetical protein [Jiangella endophytica]